MKRIRISAEHNFYDPPGKKLRPFTDAPDRDEWNTAVETCAAHVESYYPVGSSVVPSPKDMRER